MPPLPPLKDVLDALQLTVLPAAGGAALVMCLFMVLGRWAGLLGSAVAVVVGFVCANYSFPSQFAGSAPNPDFWGIGRLLPWKPDGEPPPAWHWLGRAALNVVVVGVLSRWLGLAVAKYLPDRRWWGANLLVWAPRLAAVAVVAPWLVSNRAAEESGWLMPALAATMFLEWIVLDGVARSGAGMGAGGQTAAYQAAMLIAAGALMLYAHTARFMEIEVALGCAMFGIAVAAGSTKADSSGAIPATIVFLPGLVLAGRPSLADNAIPSESYWLIALAPLALSPFMIPRLNRQTGWLTRIVRAVLVLTPLIVAITLAAQHEKLVFEEEW